MKTPMQELLTKIRKEIHHNHPEGYNIVMEVVESMVVDMLELERNRIEDFAEAYSDYMEDTPSWHCPSYEYFDNYFDETFKTK
jgi:hypothetical protein